MDRDEIIFLITFAGLVVFAMIIGIVVDDQLTIIIIVIIMCVIFFLSLRPLIRVDDKKDNQLGGKN